MIKTKTGQSREVMWSSVLRVRDDAVSPLGVCWLVTLGSSRPPSLVASWGPVQHPVRKHQRNSSNTRQIVTAVMWLSQHSQVPDLHHRDVLLRRGRLDPTGHLNDGLHQPRHVLVHFIVGAVQVCCGRWTDLLRLDLRINMTRTSVSVLQYLI